MYKKIILLFFMMQIPCAIASPKMALNKSNWKIRKQSIEMVRSSSGHIHMSSNCLSHKKCLALLAQKNAKNIKFAPVDLKGGKNPGSVLCLKLGGQDMQGTNKYGPLSFCRFEDNSYIESALLNLKYHG